MTTAAYAGSELELFAEARNWREYLRKKIAPHLGAEVLEVGAGLGSFTKVAVDGRTRRWVCVEPDPGMHGQLAALLRDGGLPDRCEALLGGIEALPAGSAFDSVIYIDVLEHIEDDAGEMRRALALLRPGGRLVVLAPAHPFLFSPFDASIGHFRRYTRGSLARLTPAGASVERMAYLDAAGLLASTGNRVLLRSAMPTKGQIAFWDRVLVRISKVLDPLLFHSVGKSVLGVWRRTG